MIRINTTLPGGNILVQKHDGMDFLLRPDYRDTEGHWFHWLFEATADRDEVIRFSFGDLCSLGTRGPAVSTDGGNSWRYRPDLCGAASTFYYHFRPGESVRFAMALPYFERDLTRFLEAHPQIQRHVLCHSRRGREVEHLVFGRGSRSILLTSRHHCCESVATYVLEGVLDEAGRIEGLLDKFTFHAVPFVDKDGVEEGDQGKNRRPHDHNRDYTEAPIYPECAAIQALGEKHKFLYAVDFHCPWLNGGLNEAVFFVEPGVEHAQKNLRDLMIRFKKEAPEELRFTPENIVVFGKTWNTGEHPTFGRHFAARPGCRSAFTLEVTYANAFDTTMTPELARRTGHAFCRTLAGCADLEAL